MNAPQQGFKERADAELKNAVLKIAIDRTTGNAERKRAVAVAAFPEFQAARARGRTGGRPSALSGDQVRAARRMYEQKDMTVAQIGEVLGVSRTTIYRALNRPPAAPASPRRATSAV